MEFVGLETKSVKDYQLGDIVISNNNVYMYKFFGGNHVLVHLNGLHSIGYHGDFTVYATKEALFNSFDIGEHYSAAEWNLQLTKKENK